ncbi:MAG: phage holin family protein [Chloroflexota bacterium]|nr:phage holin family protein [Chloroflexota bacterium]MDE2857165.1 phage holin family protein [Chloroflexota bacterium]
MRDFAIRVLINAVAIAVTAILIPNIQVANNDIATLLIIGLIFGVVNSMLKPILIVLTCPAVLLSLGLFILVINGVMLLITDALAGDRLVIQGGIWTAILGGMVMGIVSMFLETVLRLNDDDVETKDDVVIFTDADKVK